MRIVTLMIFGTLTLCLGCSGSEKVESTPPETPPELPAEKQPDDSRPQMTAADCEASGGAIVGDIGDGAIHRPDYRCQSGDPPSGSIKADPGGPIAVEGAVCCPQ